MSLKQRIKVLFDKRRMERPFFLVLFPPFNLDNLHRIMKNNAINHKSKGQIIPMTLSEGGLGIIEYDPSDLEALERKLKRADKESTDRSEAARIDGLARIHSRTLRQ